MNKNIEASQAFVSQKIDDTYIEKILQDAYIKSVRNTDEYKFGRFEERLEKEKEIFKKNFEKIISIAELFFGFVKEQFPHVKIVQYRIGIDYSSQLPAAIMIIDKKNKKDVFTIRIIARNFEKIAWSHGISECYLWTKAAGNIEQELLESDFPFYRKSL